MIISDYLALKISDIFLNYDELTGELLSKSDEISFNSQIISQEKKEKATIEATNQWYSAVNCIEEFLLSTLNNSDNNPSKNNSLMLSSIIPIINNKKLNSSLKKSIFTINKSRMALMPCNQVCPKQFDFNDQIMEFSLMSNDILKEEEFCLLFTDKFALILLLGQDKEGLAKFYFSFSPEIIKKVWLILKSRLWINHYHQLLELEKIINKLNFSNPNYNVITKFSRLFVDKISTKISSINNLKEQEKISSNINNKSQGISLTKIPLKPLPEIELLKALTHEIRTPLTTIKTITKLLLKRAKLTPDLIKHLEIIDQECSEQINRMELIFKATELQNQSIKTNQVKLIPISLDQLFTNNIPAWIKQAKRRNINLDIVLPQKLPQIVSDSDVLTQILTGLIEKFTRNIPSGNTIKMIISTAGNQLKLQFLPEGNYEQHNVKSLGQFLSFQPDTGSLYLNLDATKNIFHALGGKLIVRQKPKQAEILTVFLPLGNVSNKMNSSNFNLV